MSSSGLDPASALTFSEISDLNARKKAIKANHAEYVSGHPEIKSMLNDFMSACLLEKPQNIYNFALTHFSDLAPHHSHSSTSTGPSPLLITGPSGSGKSTLVDLLKKKYYGKFDTPLQTTSRMPRPGEDEDDYQFLPLSQVQQMIEDGKFCEYTSIVSDGVSENVIYGTTFASIQSVRSGMKICIILTDIEGYKKMKVSGLGFKSIFIKPPDLDALEDRLLDKGVGEGEVPVLLEKAKEEIEYGEGEGGFDEVVENGVLEESFEAFGKVVEKWFGKVLEEEEEEEKEEIKEEKENDKED
ncbi:hypothetical protein TrLO_g5559 [Triparma laevis f. longispina]|uniref:Guanylate kinase-like domain-containing protein n=1 Tax=Triparma laevis f. longispina TaxID=1714387 RepID=A0A9W7CD66_9STRA|nr:hypothetical protein TrLO_g5559 [Triparma laevis f. longispina]